jgi:hypothetical protein
MRPNKDPEPRSDAIRTEKALEEAKMDHVDPEFLAEMAKELEVTLRKLEQRELELVGLLGGERVEELRALWAREMERIDEDELKRNMDWDDKELIWVWARLERARQKRVLVGRTTMMTTQYGKEAGQQPEDKN